MDIITQDARFRQGAVKYSYKHMVNETAIRYKVDERTIYRWRKRFPLREIQKDNGTKRTTVLLTKDPDYKTIFD